MTERRSGRRQIRIRRHEGKARRSNKSKQRVGREEDKKE
jgi:hypothetical protein